MDATEPKVIGYCSYKFEGVPSTDILLLAKSVRTYGGSLKESPIWIFHSADDPPDTEERGRAEAISVSFKEYVPEPTALAYPFAAKAYAAADAERMAADNGSTLLWMDRDCLVFKDLASLALPRGIDLGFRPVNVKNIGQAAGAAPDPFWARCFCLAAADPDAAGTVNSYSDSERLRFYACAGLLYVRPGMRILSEWKRLMTLFASDDTLSGLCGKSAAHSLFLHQAAFTVAIASLVPPGRRLEYPPEVLYPVNFFNGDPAARRPRSIDDTVCARYDMAFENCGWRNFPFSPEVLDWIGDHA